ncbi:hypothetical protein M5K25_004435 [Dendrobium thyrsiflorum]|uniref:Uncharacterized protein n=1 Tax=Dendrobium thyrsiflorum TaxID=117978 RepID=A0ABD0VMA0_DENTH
MALKYLGITELKTQGNALTSSVACNLPSEAAETQRSLLMRSLDHWFLMFLCAAGLHNLNGHGCKGDKMRLGFSIVEFLSLEEGRGVPIRFSQLSNIARSSWPKKFLQHQNNSRFGGFTGFGRRSARKGESYLHSERAPVLNSYQNVVTSDPTGKGTSSKERSRTTTKKPKKPLVQSITSCEARKPNSNDEKKKMKSKP